MLGFLLFLALYATACAWFFVALLRWSRGSLKLCACGGSLGSGTEEFVHGARMCYPFAESLSARSA
ncbi:MAG: hypothetical protein U0R23_08620 [Candidatus Nanopelagicales bacterium]